MHWYIRVLSCKPNIYVSWFTSELRVRLTPWNRLKPSSKIYLLTVQRRYFFCGSFMFFCLLFVMPLYAFVYCALWLPARKGLTSWLSLVVSNCEFVTFSLLSWVRCGAWLYRFLIFALFLTFKINYRLMKVKSIAECSKANFLQYFLASFSYHS